jgi:hypothetical protein
LESKEKATSKRNVPFGGGFFYFIFGQCAKELHSFNEN